MKVLLIILVLLPIVLSNAFADEEVIIPKGTSVPGCEETNECYMPHKIIISRGSTVSWSNDDTAAHTVTSGTPEEGPDGIFDSGLFMAGNTFSHTFENAGTFDYFCMVHPWMEGIVVVKPVMLPPPIHPPIFPLDSDGDGIPDAIDLCPTQAETFNGFEDDDGCPDTSPPADSDGDGIPDAIDLCPTQAETFNGFEDDDGCPDTSPPADSDGDGIPDAIDLCPTQAETFNGYLDEDGCSDIAVMDSDGDGIPDAIDLCPTQHETFNGFEDDDGCPDTSPPAAVTGMLSDGTMISIWTSEPKSDKMMEINIEFADSEHVNHDIKVLQNGKTVLDDVGAHHHDGKGVHMTKALDSSDPVDVTITFQGYGIDEKTGPIGEEVVFSNIVPEFGTIAMMILAVSIISIIAVTAKSRVIPRL